MSKRCIACGMPMEKPEDFPMGDESKDYCVHCARPDGTMKSYEEALAGMTQFMVRTQGLDESVAQDAARNMMAKLPAWKDRFGG
ncbi:MAG: zinc ribbon domain-containing protein [Deltaproteobacteria bacterium]|nr:zinc ribbon domain-containing protein [Deltaproteobacteria bacterium]MBW2017993.1 zinc ribbon domain-containing protein [Deltaproteobacteria bacterium]MBW2305215.1 zinc ribbon domain-containing protein [Deltaproteobacteria bacterium]